MSRRRPPDPARPTSIDEDREAILARRRKFVASALAGLGLASCEPTPGPQVCLSATAIPVDATDAGAPQPCLSPPVRTPDAGASIDGGDAADAGASDGGKAADAGDAGTPAGPDAGSDASAPKPCLKVKPPPQPTPKPCLKVAPMACLFFSPDKE